MYLASRVLKSLLPARMETAVVATEDTIPRRPTQFSVRCWPPTEASLRFVTMMAL
jgi:hypothetical protein